MTATIAEPCTVDTQHWKRVVLDGNHDAMVDYLVNECCLPEPFAAAMIDQLWVRLVNRIIEDNAHEGIDRPLAERIMNEALGFLNLCAWESGHSPSPMVDKGWHALLHYSYEDEALGYALAGRRLYHMPSDVEGFSDTIEGRGKCEDEHCHCKSAARSVRRTISDTLAALRQLGPVDEELWVRT